MYNSKQGGSGTIEIHMSIPITLYTLVDTQSSCQSDSFSIALSLNSYNALYQYSALTRNDQDGCNRQNGSCQGHLSQLPISRVLPIFERSGVPRA